MISELSQLYSGYSNFIIPNQNRCFNYNQFLEKFNELSFSKGLTKSVIGKSELGNDIYKVKIGNGPIKVMAWSQIHGNEATGTLAMLELLNMFERNSDAFNQIWDELTFVYIPMVNPDGANVNTRRNGLNVDLNRDAQARMAKETQLLVAQIELEKPDVALNLHDQRNIFGVMHTENPATISFLAPSYNLARDVNLCREQCMMLIASLNESIQEEIGAHVGRYTDEFYPTAFGEYVQSKGIPCVLIESGAHRDDTNREVARKMNVKCVLKLFSTLIDNGWKKRSKDEYAAIPENNTHFYDVIIRNMKLNFGDRIVLQDIGLLVNQRLEKGVLIDYYQINDFGDLRFKFGLEEFDASSEEMIIKSPELNELITYKSDVLGLHFLKGVRK